MPTGPGVRTSERLPEIARMDSGADGGVPSCISVRAEGRRTSSSPGCLPEDPGLTQDGSKRDDRWRQRLQAFGHVLREGSSRDCSHVGGAELDGLFNHTERRLPPLLARSCRYGRCEGGEDGELPVAPIWEPEAVWVSQHLFWVGQVGFLLPDQELPRSSPAGRSGTAEVAPTCADTDRHIMLNLANGRLLNIVDPPMVGPGRLQPVR